MGPPGQPVDRDGAHALGPDREKPPSLLRREHALAHGHALVAGFPKVLFIPCQARPERPRKDRLEPFPERPHHGPERLFPRLVARLRVQLAVQPGGDPQADPILVPDDRIALARTLGHRPLQGGFQRILSPLENRGRGPEQHSDGSLPVRFFPGVRRQRRSRLVGGYEADYLYGQERFRYSDQPRAYHESRGRVQSVRHLLRRRQVRTADNLLRKDSPRTPPAELQLELS